MRIGQRFHRNGKDYEITDIIVGVNVCGKLKTMIFYHNIKTKEAKAKSAKSFREKFGL